MMKSLKLATLFSLLTLALALSVHAGDKKDDKSAEKKAKVEQTTAKAKADEPVTLKKQTHCPVMGGEIDSSAYTDIQGQRVYHCCPMCSAKLKADPDKFFKQAAADGIVFENIQTKCPVSGEALGVDAKFFDYEGRRVYVCCEKCQSEFMKDPKAYLEKMTEQAKPVKKDAGSETKKAGQESDNHDHAKGHNH